MPPQIPQGPQRVYGRGQQGASQDWIQLYNQTMDPASSASATPSPPPVAGPGDAIAPSLMLDRTATDAFRSAINAWAASGGDTTFVPPLPLPPSQRAELARRLAALTAQSQPGLTLPGIQAVDAKPRDLPFSVPLTSGESHRDRFAKYLLEVSQTAGGRPQVSKSTAKERRMRSRQALGKAGVGSRGGTVIGTTKSGKPIYQADHPSYAAMHSAHASAGSTEDEDHAATGGALKAGRGYSRQDHLDAADAHSSAASKMGRGHPLRAQSHVASQGHAMASMVHDRVRSPEKAEKSCAKPRALDVLRRALTRG